jgi:CMP-2-keto-3-deoxyoctulosonic acid synthetase
LENKNDKKNLSKYEHVGIYGFTILKINNYISKLTKCIIQMDFSLISRIKG